MDQQFNFRALLIKLQDCLSDNDRRRLHFIVGNTIPRHLRDDSTLIGTLSLLELLFDRAKISEQNFGYLIQAFREIHCYEIVKRLQEYQLTKQDCNRCGTTVSDLFADNENDTFQINNDFTTVTLSNSSDAQESICTDQIPLPITSTRSEKKRMNNNLTLIKQTLQSWLTTCQLILLLLNIFGICVLMIILLKKQSCSMTDMTCTNGLVLREGSLYGETLGGADFEDAVTNLLSLNDKLIRINASWSSDALNSITFIYSNGETSHHGSSHTMRPSLYSAEINLNIGENFNGVSVYRGLRDIGNPYEPNGTMIIVGLRFLTNTGRQSDLFGSSNGTEYEELFPDYGLAYVRGRSYVFIETLQFIWYKEYTYTE